MLPVLLIQYILIVKEDEQNQEPENRRKSNEQKIIDDINGEQILFTKTK
jgi:hypothetical protein